MKKFTETNYLKISQIILAAVILIMPVYFTFSSFAQASGDPNQILPPTVCQNLQGVKCGGAQDTDVTGIILTIVNYALGLAGLIAVVFLIYGGYLYIFSGASEELAEKGKKAIINALIGIVIIILSYVIVRIVVGTINSSVQG